MRVANDVDWVRLILCILISQVSCLLSANVAVETPHGRPQRALDVWGADEPSQPVDIKPDDHHKGHRAAVISRRGQPSDGGRRQRRHRPHHHNHAASRDNNDGGLTKTTLDELADDGADRAAVAARSAPSDVPVATNNNQQGQQLAWPADEGKTNPLIESERGEGRLFSQAEQQVAGDVPYGERPYLSENEEEAAAAAATAEEEEEDQQGEENNNAKNIKPLQSGQSDHHGGAEGQTRLETIHFEGPNRDEQPLAVGQRDKHKGPHWCHMNCNINDGHHHHHQHRHSQQHNHHNHHSSHQDRSKIICASDGRFYASMCELRRFACLNDVHLFKRPISKCSTRSKTINYNEHEELGLARRLGANRNDGLASGDDAPPSLPGGTQTADNNNNNNAASESNGDNYDDEADLNHHHYHHHQHDDKVRFIELKRHCNRGEFGHFKAALLDEFGGKTELMFRYFDTNNDGYIEAHELWPRLHDDGGGTTTGDDNATDNQTTGKANYYAQVWEDHSRDCQSRSSDHYHGHNLQACWFFLDFAFEPHFAWSPCSLSHLVLFDLANPNYKFDYQTFEAAFSDLKTTRPPGDQLGRPSTNVDEIHTESHVSLTLGQSKLLDCLPAIEANHLHDPMADNLDLGQGGGLRFDDNNNPEENQQSGNNNDDNLMQNARCQWTRYSWPISSVRDPHISMQGADRISANFSEHSAAIFANPRLFLREAQLYLSGQYKCSCSLQKSNKIISHLYKVQVLAEPKVIVRPSHQWSLANSTASFECRHDFIDTRFGSNTQLNNANDQNAGLKIDWFKDDRELLGDGKIHTDTANATTNAQVEPHFSSDIIRRDGRSVDQDKQLKISPSSSRASFSMASTRLALEGLHSNDTGEFVCRVRVAIEDDDTSKTTNNIEGHSQASLLVDGQPNGYQEGLPAEIHEGPSGAESETYLWMFHDNGISVFKVENDDGAGQEMELVREINGHSLVSPEVDGNWNQLTLCGGLNQEQVVICEWSDNALYVNVPLASSNTSNYTNNDSHKIRSQPTSGQRAGRPTQKYIYVGQPNLNRVIVMDGLKFEIVAIINTEPQPRKLFPARPNKIHLSKWVRRRLSPIANARWLAAIGSHAHELQLTPSDSQLGSLRPTTSPRRARQTSPHDEDVSQFARRQTVIRHTFAGPTASRPAGMPSKLIQHDIWLLCYGQPLVVSPSGDDHLDESPSGLDVSPTRLSNNATSSMASMMNLISDKPAKSGDTSGAANPIGATGANSAPMGASIEPFTPRLSHTLAWPSMAGWPVGTPTARESRLRNRKSVQIIQSTFFPRFLDSHEASDTTHAHWPDAKWAESAQGNQPDGQQWRGEKIQEKEQQQQRKRRKSADMMSTVGKFKRVTVLTTHYVFAGTISGRQMMAATAATAAASAGHQPTSPPPPFQRYQVNQFDLIQDLTVPVKPYPLLQDTRYKQHHAYVSHYDEQRLYRVSMDEYRYDRQIDLQDCDPIHVVAAAQGLLIVQCRARITHSLIGQLVLDELTASRLQFNENIRAQEAHLSPDNRYLVSIYTNTSTSTGQPTKRQSAEQEQNNDKQQRRQSIIYVQLVSVEGLRLQYEIKTSLDISQCSFVWKEGYYAAIFVSTNRQEQQSEVLSLRLADGRLELMVRVPGLVSTSRHKEVLSVLPELQVAALSTSQATYIIDMEENRVTQTMHHHQSTPTLLWVN